MVSSQTNPTMPHARTANAHASASLEEPRTQQDRWQTPNLREQTLHQTRDTRASVVIHRLCNFAVCVTGVAGVGSWSKRYSGYGGYSGGDGTFYLKLLQNIGMLINGNGQETKDQRGGGCPTNSPCRLKGGKCCDLVLRQRHKVCPIRC